jgi:hypothetical protein
VVTEKRKEMLGERPGVHKRRTLRCRDDRLHGVDKIDRLGNDPMGGGEKM